MSTMNTLKATTAVLAIAAMFALTGCSGEGATSTPVGTATASAPAMTESTSAPTADPVPVPAVGATLTTEQAGLVAGGQHAYPMADGTLVLTDEAEPLPPAVVADIAAPVFAADDSLNGGQDHGVTVDAAKAQASKTIAKTGLNAIVIYRVVSADGVRYQATGAAMVKPAPVAKATAMDSAVAYVAAQANPAAFIIIDGTGE